MLTDRFYSIRKKELDLIFSKKNIAEVWRKIVRDQLRRVDILDIYDYYDYNYNIDTRALLIRSDILTGNFEGSKPLIYRIEKKLGVCRHLVIPQPTDALILQIITESISKEILSNQPSNNAFYSRDKHNLRKPYEIDDYGLDWRKQWKIMQKQIYKFNDEKEFIIVTDLSNYYDSIFVPELRKIISGYVNNKEVLSDLLYNIIECISWKPDYLPYVGRGLPTTNLEGIRLLAHSFLFEFDSILKEKSKDNFTRWMDDIVIGVDSREEAIETLSSASDVLKSRGLALNLQKTNIYDEKETRFQFLIDENRHLDNIDYKKYSNNRISEISNKLGKDFRKHLKYNNKAKYFEKVSKRYITAFGKLKSKRILSMVPKLFNENPGIRQNLLIYLSILGYGKRTADIVIKVINELKPYDDISLFNVCKLITEWLIPVDSNGEKFIKNVIKAIFEHSKNRKTTFDFYCLLWLKTKYDHPRELYNFLIDYENIWKTNPFLRRQVTAILGRLLLYKEDKVKTLLTQQISTSESQVVSVATSILGFASIGSIETKVKMYLFPKAKPRVYPLQKFLVLCTFLNSEIYREDDSIKKSINEYIIDPYYKKWLDFQYDLK